MTREEAIYRKISAYTLDDVKALSLLLLVQNEPSEAYELNSYANSVMESVVNTVTAHTSNDNNCLACVLKVSWALATNSLSYLEELGEDMGDDLIGKAREMIRGVDEQMESIRRD